MEENPQVLSIKHLAFAVRDARRVLEAYCRFLGVSPETEVREYSRSRNRVALFKLGGIEFQLCESLDPGGRFDAWIQERGYEGLHHICYEVRNLDKALEHALSNGARLRVCQACGVYGKHPHPEGYVAFLEDEVGGIEIEFMQVYTETELGEYERVQGL